MEAVPLLQAGIRAASRGMGWVQERGCTSYTNPCKAVSWAAKLCQGMLRRDVAYNRSPKEIRLLGFHQMEINGSSESRHSQGG